MLKAGNLDAAPFAHAHSMIADSYDLTLFSEREKVGKELELPT
jgi:hypothetical protein